MKKQKIKLVILDCDGVILDSNRLYEELYEQLFRKYGVRKSPKEIYAHFGESPMHILRVIFPGRDTRKIFADYKKQLKNISFSSKIRINRGAKNSIRDMRK